MSLSVTLKRSSLTFLKHWGWEGSQVARLNTTLHPGLERPIFCSDIWVKPSFVNLVCLSRVCVQTRPKRCASSTLLVSRQKRVSVPLKPGQSNEHIITAKSGYVTKPHIWQIMTKLLIVWKALLFHQPQEQYFSAFSYFKLTLLASEKCLLRKTEKLKYLDKLRLSEPVQAPGSHVIA